MKRTAREWGFSGRLVEEGYRARKRGAPCMAPTRTELGRGAWEQGWRAANNELARKQEYVHGA